MRQIDRTIKATGQKTEVGLNEFIPFIDDYCNCTCHEEQCNNYSLPTGIGDSKCPNWQLPKTGGGEHDSSLGQGIGINRATWPGNAAAAVFALGYATLAELGYAFVGADQLVGGVWPDNEPAASCLDWQTGEPNAKYYAIQALARTVGSSAPKTIFTATTGQHSPPVGTIGNGTCGATNYGGDCDVLPKGAWHLAAENITEEVQDGTVRVILRRGWQPRLLVVLWHCVRLESFVRGLFQMWHRLSSLLPVQLGSVAAVRATAHPTTHPTPAPHPTNEMLR